MSLLHTLENELLNAGFISLTTSNIILASMEISMDVKCAIVAILVRCNWKVVNLCEKLQLLFID